MSYHLGANPGAGPTGPQPHDAPPNRRPLWAAAAAVVLVAALVTSAAAGGLRDDDPETASTGTTTNDDDDDKQTTTSTAGSDDTTSSTDDSDGSTETVTLTADDWGPEARAEWVDQCVNTEIGSAGELAGQSADETCGCIYDHIEQGDLSFENFRDGVASDADVDPTSELGVAMSSAATACAIAAI